MASILDYAALSTLVYNDVRGVDNRLVLPTGWTEIVSDAGGLGFTASAYQNGNEIVIAFKGTDIILANATMDWLAGNIPAGLMGIGSTQLLNAALFYEAVKAANPGASITFTGHSLGGGLASLMSVYFDKPATTFAEAPFLLTAISPLVTGLLGASLVLNGISDSNFAGFAANPLATGIRLPNVHDYYINGEILNYLRSPLTAIYGQDSPITVGGVSLLQGNVVSKATTLHSMNLTASLLMSQTFQNDTVSLPYLLSEIFNVDLYANAPEGQASDFLIHLLSDQIRVGYTNTDGLLKRFAADIDKLTYDSQFKTGELSKALIDVAIADYYFMQSGFSGKDFFNTLTGGISFDLADIGADWANNKTIAPLANAMTQLHGLDSYTGTLLMQDNYWTIQSGADALNMTGIANNNDAMIGGATADVLDGGNGNDTLYGGREDDQISGGAGEDYLIGGADNDTLYGNDGAVGDILDGGVGFDTYYADNGDRIREGDGEGQVFLNGNKLGVATRKKGEIVYKDAAGNFYFQNGTSLQVEGLLIEDFHYGDLGITFREDDPENPLKKAFKKARVTRSPIVLDLDGNGISTQNLNNGNAFFDHDGNGFAERTGWASAGDGILVRDLNKNGKIDNGSELFGDHTLLQNGQASSNGFIALADLDSN